MITLEEAKNYLRVDWNEDDALIERLLQTSHKLVADVGRIEIADEDDDETVRIAILYSVAYLYENRNTADMKKLTFNLRSLLFAQREGVI